MPEFFQTQMGHTFYEVTVPRIARALERIATALEKHEPPVVTNPDNIPMYEAGTDAKVIGTYFVTSEDGLVYCERCAQEKGLDPAHPDTNLWEVLGDNWCAPCVCAGCDLSIPVYVDGNPEDERPHRKRERKPTRTK